MAAAMARVRRVGTTDRVSASTVVERGMRLAQALHRAGAPSWRVESAVVRLGSQLGFPLHCFASPTSIQVFGEGVQRLERVSGADIDLGAQVRISGGLAESPAVLKTILQELTERPAAGPGQTLLLWTGLSVATAVALGGQAGTALGALVLGAAVGLVVIASSRWASWRALVPMLAGAVVATGAPVLAAFTPMDGGLAALGAIVVLLPGWSLTVGVAEVATGHLSSGGARLTSALVTLLLLALGQAGGSALAEQLALAPLAGPEPVLAGTGLGLLAVVGMGAMLGVMFQAPLRHLPWTVFGVGVAWVVRLAPLGPAGEAFAAALVLGVLGNLMSRGVGLPAQLVVVPGIMLRVPGASALSAMGMLMRHEPGGLDAFVDAVSISGALVGGLLTAGMLVSPKDDS